MIREESSPGYSASRAAQAAGWKGEGESGRYADGVKTGYGGLQLGLGGTSGNGGRSRPVCGVSGAAQLHTGVAEGFVRRVRCVGGCIDDCIDECVDDCKDYYIAKQILIASPTCD